MGAMASQITCLTIVLKTVYSVADQRKHQSSASLAFVRGTHRGPVNSPHKGTVTRKIFPFDDVIMGKPSEKALTRWYPHQRYVILFLKPGYPLESEQNTHIWDSNHALDNSHACCHEYSSCMLSNCLVYYILFWTDCRLCYQIRLTYLNKFILCNLGIHFISKQVN